MARRPMSVLVLGVLFLVNCGSRGNASAPGEAPRGDAPTPQRQLWERVFGPAPSRNTVVTGVDAEGLAGLLLPTNARLLEKAVTPLGVRYLYSTGGPPKTNVSLLVGVFASAAAGLDALDVASRRWSMFPPGVRGIGDVAFLSNGTVLLVVNNVVIRLSLPAGSTEEARTAARRIAEELESGERFVSRGKEVKAPEIVSVELPAQVKLGQEVTGNVIIRGIDPAQALVGVEYEWPRTPHPVQPEAKPGNPPTITVRAPRDPRAVGERKLTVVVATPQNVIATKEIRIVVSSE